MRYRRIGTLSKRVVMESSRLVLFRLSKRGFSRHLAVFTESPLYVCGRLSNYRSQGEFQRRICNLLLDLLDHSTTLRWLRRRHRPSSTVRSFFGPQSGTFITHYADAFSNFDIRRSGISRPNSFSFPSLVYASLTMVAISHLIHNWMNGAATAASLGGQGFWVSGLGGCNVSKAVLPVPAGQTILKAPTNLTLNFIGLAFGVQNYTCSKNNNYT
jgi:hypothetical protein